MTKNESPVAVIQDMEQHQKLVDALTMLKLIVQGEKDVQSGKTRKQKRIFKRLSQRLEKRVE